MKSYLLTLLATAVVVTIISILTPDGEKNGISKHIGFLSALCIICVLIAPLGQALEALRTAVNGDTSFPWEDSAKDSEADLRQELQDTLDDAGYTYFTEMLTQTLEQRFQIEAGEIRCVPHWSDSTEHPRPEKITVILSGGAIWKDAGAIEKFVTSLLGCPCVSVIE